MPSVAEVTKKSKDAEKAVLARRTRVFVIGKCPRGTVLIFGRIV